MVRTSVIVLALFATSAFGQAAPLDLQTLKLCSQDEGSILSSAAIPAPATGIESEIEIGQAMASTKEASIRLIGLGLDKPLQFRDKAMGANYEVSFPAGNLQSINTKKGVRYTSDIATFKYDRDSKPRSGLGKPVIFIYPNPSNASGLLGSAHIGFSTKVTPIADAKFSQQKCLYMRPNGFRNELIYTGITKGSISLQYREFMDNYARPAFSQDLHYDLANGDEIGFKGARIKIIKATNTTVRYIILKPLD